MPRPTDVRQPACAGTVNDEPDGMPVRVLVVDDSRSSADALGTYLRAGGMEVRVVYHGSDALREARAWLPACIVLDVAMPGLSGIGVATMLRSNNSTGKIPLVAFTAFDTSDNVREMENAGFDAVCRKPADLSRLEALIRTLSVPAGVLTSPYAAGGEADPPPSASFRG